MSRRLYISGSRRFAQPPFGVSRYGKFHRRFLDKFPGAAYAGAAQDLGNRRGVVTFTGRSVNSVYNPTWDLRRGSDDAERAFTWPGIRDGVAEAWIGSGVNAYLITQYDQSGNDNDATQSTAARQPLVYDGSDWTRDSAGNIAATFDKVDDYLNLQAGILAGNAYDISVFVISENADTLGGLLGNGVNNHNITPFNNPSSPGGFFSGFTHSTGALQYLRNTDPSGGAHVMSTFLNSATGEKTGFKDGVASYENPLTQGNVSTTFNVIGMRGNNVDFINGTLTVLLIYETYEGANRAAIEAALADMYNITLA